MSIATHAVPPVQVSARRRRFDPVDIPADEASRRAHRTTAAAAVLATFGAALVIASQRAAAYVGPVAFAAGVGETVLAGLLLLRVRHAGTIGVLTATTGVVFAGIAALAAVAGRDPFVALGGAGGDAKGLVAAVALIAIGYLVVLAGARKAR